ncbi:uncharacterized protein At4g15970-like isoform X2 [Pistacia vera]|uniref:uncharacterized protein At4g15970-like isoform X2 n=1 Tax=Pistacia vera TaxID=55513 RepID=UPI001262C2AD|nr:uncharacterized protein At4g15970-like isoform X2 [Pistacia vera]XP_031283253.1 uncharacterized protein At4g15970-like isoform X2 [Pistacia vera]
MVRLKPFANNNNNNNMLIESPARRLVVLIACIFISCLILYSIADSLRFLPVSVYGSSSAFPSIFPSVIDTDSLLDSEEYRLEKVLKNAAMEDNTVILTTLNEAWAAPNSVLDLFLESFRIGYGTRRLLNHLEAYFMTPDYLKMMWRRIDFLRTVLEMGYNFVFTDADVMWFRNPFLRFYSDADFEIACDYFLGTSDDLQNRANGGFNHVKSNNRSIEFYKFWYSSRETYPGSHDQDVLNNIKFHPLVTDIGLKMKFLDTSYFGGLCEPSEDFSVVCTMHANCCYGLDSKLQDIRIMLQDWKSYLSLPPTLKSSLILSWRVPYNCRFRLTQLRKLEANLCIFILLNHSIPKLSLESLYGR